MSEFGGSVTENEGFFTRIKNAIVGVLIGIVMFFGSFALLWWNEGRSVQAINGLAQASQAVVSVDASKVDPANEKKLIHYSAEAKTDEVVQDERFRIRSQALRLIRTVEMYQYKEKSETRTSKKIGGGKKKTTTYTYQEEWSEDLISSSNFHNSSYQNPSSMPFKSKSIIAKKVMTGAFELPANLVTEISARAKVDLAKQFAEGGVLPENCKIDGGYLFRSTSGNSTLASPIIGDLRISFELVPASMVSIMAEQSGNSLAKSIMPSGYEVYFLYDGKLTAKELIKKQQDLEAMITWILRVVGFLLMTIGGYLVLRPLEVVADVIPFLGDLVGFGLLLASGLVAAIGSTITIGLAWVFYRPLLGGSLLAIAVGLIVFVATRKKKTEAKA